MPAPVRPTLVEPSPKLRMCSACKNSESFQRWSSEKENAMGASAATPPASSAEVTLEDPMPKRNDERDKFDDADAAFAVIKSEKKIRNRVTLTSSPV